MKNAILLLFALLFYFVSLAQTDSGSNIQPGNIKLTCLVLGSDSIIYYTGSSGQMLNVKKGKISDTAFINGMFRVITDNEMPMTLKPGDGGNMLFDFQKILGFANTRGIIDRSMDSINVSEQKAFGYSSPPQIRAAIKNQEGSVATNYSVNLPKFHNSIPGFPKASQMVILVSDSTGIYAYMGGNMSRGKKYSYPELRKTLNVERVNKQFSVLIKAAKSCTYKNVVDMLDVMTITNIKQYALTETTKSEDGYLRTLNW